MADLAARAHPFHVAVENWRSDHNIGAVVRNANAFGAAGVHIVGRRRWNRRGAMATDRYLPVHHHTSVDELVTWAVAEGLVVVGVDNVEGARPIESGPLPERCLLLFGQEGPGPVRRRPGRRASEVVSITQYGSTRSLNAGVASGIALHAWARSARALTRLSGPGGPAGSVETWPTSETPPSRSGPSRTGPSAKRSPLAPRGSPSARRGWRPPPPRSWRPRRRPVPSAPPKRGPRTPRGAGPSPARSAPCARATCRSTSMRSRAPGARR